MTEPPEFPPPSPDPSQDPPVQPPPYQAPMPYPGSPPASPPSYPQQPSPWGEMAYGQTAPAPKPGTNGFAIAALIFGIIPICFIGIIFAIVALVQIGKSGQKGKGFAIAGLVLSGLWLIGIVTAGVIGAMDSADRDSSGAITKEGKVSADDLHVGDCFNGLNDIKVGDNINSVTAVPCSKLHEAEAFAQVELPGSSYPGQEALQSEKQGRPCVQKLQEVAPKAYKTRAVGVIWIFPQKFSWKLGDHHLTCVAISIGRRTGSVLE